MNPADLHLSGLRTRLYPLIRQHVAEEAQPVADRLQAWRMMSANGLATTDVHGRPVSYRGVSFEGSPRTVFWEGFFEPFLLKAARGSFQRVAATCRERNLNIRDHLVETRDLLHLLVARTYESMASIDQALRGRGHPSSTAPISIAAKVAAMRRDIDHLLVAFAHDGLPLAAQRASREEIVELKPNIHGLGINLRALWRRLRRAP